MLSALALIDLHTIFSARTALVPVTGAVVATFAFALFRGRIGRLLPFGKEQGSLMNFSSMGTLRCICGETHPKGVGVDRRQFCRSCGCEVAATNSTLFDKHLTQKEIETMTSSLQIAAMRASHLELPPTITTIEELQRYLDTPLPKIPRTPPTSPGQIRQQQVH